jgi:hypothetical protein
MKRVIPVFKRPIINNHLMIREEMASKLNCGGRMIIRIREMFKHQGRVIDFPDGSHNQASPALGSIAFFNALEFLRTHKDITVIQTAKSRIDLSPDGNIPAVPNESAQILNLDIIKVRGKLLNKLQIVFNIHIPSIRKDTIIHNRRSFSKFWVKGQAIGASSIWSREIIRAKTWILHTELRRVPACAGMTEQGRAGTRPVATKSTTTNNYLPGLWTGRNTAPILV